MHDIMFVEKTEQIFVSLKPCKLCVGGGGMKYSIQNDSNIMYISIDMINSVICKLICFCLQQDHLSDDRKILVPKEGQNLFRVCFSCVIVVRQISLLISLIYTINM